MMTIAELNSPHQKQNWQSTFSNRMFAKWTDSATQKGKRLLTQEEIELIKKFLVHNIESWGVISAFVLRNPESGIYNQIRFTIFIHLIDIYQTDASIKDDIYVMLREYLLSTKSMSKFPPLEAGYFFSWDENGSDAELLLLDVLEKGKSRIGRLGALYGIFEFYKCRNLLTRKTNIFKNLSKSDRSNVVRNRAEYYLKYINSVKGD